MYWKHRILTAMVTDLTKGHWRWPVSKMSNSRLSKQGQVVSIWVFYYDENSSVVHIGTSCEIKWKLKLSCKKPLTGPHAALGPWVGYSCSRPMLISLLIFSGYLQLYGTLKVGLVRLLQSRGKLHENPWLLYCLLGRLTKVANFSHFCWFCLLYLVQMHSHSKKCQLSSSVLVFFHCRSQISGSKI